MLAAGSDEAEFTVKRRWRGRPRIAPSRVLISHITLVLAARGGLPDCCCKWIGSVHGAEQTGVVMTIGVGTIVLILVIVVIVLLLRRR